jgi:hypothetical protein
MSRRIRPLPTNEEMWLETLAGTARAVATGKVKQAQLDGLKRTYLRWGFNPVLMDLTIANKKAPPRITDIMTNA